MSVPLQQSLAINELDEAQIGRFSFRTRESMEDVRFLFIYNLSLCMTNKGHPYNKTLSCMDTVFSSMHFFLDVSCSFPKVL